MEGRDKLFIDVLGRPLLLYCLEAFESSSHVDTIAVATATESVSRVGELAREYGVSKLSDVVAGGARRQDSVSTRWTRLERSTSLSSMMARAHLWTAQP